MNFFNNKYFIYIHYSIFIAISINVSHYTNANLMIIHVQRVILIKFDLKFLKFLMKNLKIYSRI